MDQQKKVCLFCGGDESIGTMNVEHFIPKALWDGARPGGTKTVPAHANCNKSFSDDIDYFRDFLAMDAATNGHPEVKRLLEGKVGRKIAKRRQSMQHKMKPVILPNVSEGGVYLGNAVFMQINPTLLTRVLQNMARGLYCSDTGRLIPNDCRITVIHLDNHNVDKLGEFVASLGKTESFGDDVFRYKRNFEPDAMACVLDFYRSRRFLCYATWTAAAVGTDSQTPSSMA